MIARSVFIAATVLVIAGTALADSHRTKAPKGAEVYFLTPNDGETVSNPVTVKFGLKGMGVAPAGVEKKMTGHHHLLIDTKLEDYDNAVSSDKSHRHFGGGQTEVSISLSPGMHTLQLVLGDHNHIPHAPPVQSKRITITVK